MQAGFKVSNLGGGYKTYQMFGEEVVNETPAEVSPQPSDS
jgi:hypothetical protein